MVLGALGSLLGLEPDIDIIGTATDGEEALRLVQTLQPDILLTDIEMPERSGLDVAAEIRRRGLGTRVVILTTFGRPGYLRRAMESGVSGFIVKDSPAEKLARTIREIRDGKSAIGLLRARYVMSSAGSSTAPR